MKILVLEDNERLSSLIFEALSQKNYHVDIYDNGKIALNAIDNGYDCFILDINVPGIDGISILNEIRSMDSHTPIIIISANIDLETIKDAYYKGCDDYLKKPFYMYELETKLERLCNIEDKVIKLNDNYVFDLAKEKLLNENAEEVKLAKKEILLLDLLSKNRGKIVSFEQIEQYVWEGDLTSTENIRALIKRIRKKLPKNTIKSQGGMGYSLNTLT